MIYKDGHTAFRNITGKSFKRPVANFREKVLYMPLKTERLKMDKVEPKMKEGLWLCIRHRSDEAIIGTADGVVKARTMRRQPKDQRWDQALINNLRGTPRRPIPRVESDHIRTDEQSNIEPDVGEDEVITAMPREEETPRRMYITKATVEKYGKTPGCPGCVAMEIGKYGGRRRLEEDQRRVARRTDMVLNKAIEKELHKNPGIRKEVEECTDQRQKGSSSSSSSSALTPPQTTMPTEDVEMSVRHDKRKNDDKSDEPSDKKHRADMMNLETTVDVAEVFSPPRITAVAQRIGLRSSCNLDLTTHDTDGKPWDFDSKEMRNRAILKIVAEKPYVLITSTMFADFSVMMNATGRN